MSEANKTENKPTPSAHCWIVGISAEGYAPCRDTKRWVTQNLGKNYPRYSSYAECKAECDKKNQAAK